MSSRIEAGMTIEGSVRGDGELVVAGRLRGVLGLQGNLVIEEGGAVEAEVEANSVVVGGLLSGSVIAHDELRIQPGGYVDARVRAARLAVADGAVFRGELQAANAPTHPALAAGHVGQRLTAGARPEPARAPQAAASTAHTHTPADALPPLPTVNTSGQSRTRVAATAPPVPAAVRPPSAPPPPLVRGGSILPPPPAQPSGVAVKPPSAVPPAPAVPTAVAPAAKSHAKAASATTPTRPGARVKPFSSPPPKPDAAPQPIRPAQPPPREAGAPRMPGLPRGRSSFDRRGGGT